MITLGACIRFQVKQAVYSFLAGDMNVALYRIDLARKINRVRNLPITKKL